MARSDGYTTGGTHQTGIEPGLCAEGGPGPTVVLSFTPVNTSVGQLGATVVFGATDFESATDVPFVFVRGVWPEGPDGSTNPQQGCEEMSGCEQRNGQGSIRPLFSHQW